MFEKSDLILPNWKFIPIGLLVFLLPSVAVSVKSGATSVFLLILVPSLIFAWMSLEKLFKEEKFLLSCFLLYVLLVGFSLINSSDLNEGFGSYERFLRFVVFIPMYMFVRKYSLELGPWIAWGLVLGCAVTGMVAIYQHHWLDVARPGGARHWSRYGLTAVSIFLLLSLAIIFEYRKTKFLVLGLISAVIILYAIKLNQTRAAMLSVVPFIGLLGFYFINKFNKKTALVFALFGVAIAVVFLHPSSPVAQSFLQGINELQNMAKNPSENYSSSWGLRPHMMHTGVLIFLQSPIIGTGLGDYALDAQALMDSGRTYIKDGWLLTSPHNIYVSILAEAGLLGFVGFIMAVCIAPIHCYWKIYKQYGQSPRIAYLVLSGVTTSICFLLFGFFHTWININNAVSIFLLLHLVFLSNAFNLIQKNKAV
ncbi:MAG: hypothetical protein GKR92_07740 [Gammaproteobacteria bacterium]|nr:MAG: hypothetical protein GKR92_07740 [Gammaproteobacteria bacterium]